MYEIFEEKEVIYGDVETSQLFYFKGDEEKRIRVMHEICHIIHDLPEGWLPGEVYPQNEVSNTYSDEEYNRPCIVIKLKWKT